MGGVAFDIDPALYEAETPMYENACIWTRCARYAHSIANGKGSWSDPIACLYDNTGGVVA